MEMKAFQDYYPDDLAHCYGCGYLNPHGYQIKSYWDGNEGISHFKPKPYHTDQVMFTGGSLQKEKSVPMERS